MSCFGESTGFTSGGIIYDGGLNTNNSWGSSNMGQVYLNDKEVAHTNMMWKGWGHASWDNPGQANLTWHNYQFPKSNPSYFSDPRDQS